MKKQILMMAGILVLIAMGCGISNGADVKVIKWVNIVPLSGPAAPWGIAAQRGVRMGVEDLGAFEVAGQTYKWQVTDYDSKYSPSEALSALNRAIFTDNIRIGVIIGAGLHPPLLPVIRENRFLDLAFMAGGKTLTNPTNPTLFRVMPSSDQLCGTFFEDIYRIYKTKRVAVMAPNDELGKGEYELLTQLHKERKPEAEIVAAEFFDRATTDFYPALKRVLSKNPDMIFSDSSPTGIVALIAKQARELGFTNVIYNPSGILEAKVLIDTAGIKGSHNILNPRLFPEPPTKLFADIKRRYEERYKEDMGAQVPELYPLPFWIAEAMKRAKSIDIEKVITTLPNTEWNAYPLGPAKWGGEKFYGIKRQIVYPLPLSILQDGKWKLVMTKEMTLD